MSYRKKIRCFLEKHEEVTCKEVVNHFKDLPPKTVKKTFYKMSEMRVIIKTPRKVRGGYKTERVFRVDKKDSKNFDGNKFYY